jgi:gamma-glutamylcyclotransferase (GGCT)/AIG2-like uncharacterized protein YtfP
MRVDGTVFELPEDPQVLDALDRTYSPCSEPIRSQAPARRPYDWRYDCWAYEYNGNPDGALVIASGRYERPGERRP